MNDQSIFWWPDGAGIVHRLRRYHDLTGRWQLWCTDTAITLDDSLITTNPGDATRCRNCAAELHTAAIAAEQLAAARARLQGAV